MKNSNESDRIRWAGSLQNNYGVPNISLARGKGAVVWDVEGNRYLDFLGGIATSLLGHGHPAIITAVSEQIRELSHVSNLYMHEQALQLAEQLIACTGEESARVFFCNSGAEANEAAIKLSRLTGRTRIISMAGAFHGRTIGSLSITGQEGKRAPFLPLLKDVKFAEYGSTSSLARLISKKVAMVIVEPIQGENGIVVPPPGYLQEVRMLCDKYGALLCIDAVQTGMGRTGRWFGYEKSGITPDIITLAKGLGGGLPLGAMISVTKSTPAFNPGDHGSTFGGNPVACAAGLAAISVIEKKSLLSRVTTIETLIKEEISKLPGVVEVRGEGLLLGIVLAEEISSALVATAAANGLLLNAAKPTVIRIAPALIISDAQVREFIKKFSHSLARSRRGESR